MLLFKLTMERGYHIISLPLATDNAQYALLCIYIALSSVDIDEDESPMHEAIRSRKTSLNTNQNRQKILVYSLKINTKAQLKTRIIGILKTFNISDVSSRLTTSSENEYLQSYN